MLSYEEAVKYILDIPMFAQKIGRENLAGLLARLGNPEKHSHIIHVAGTNGKGSTCKMLATLLMKSGCRVGLFTSPHLVKINERIRINDEIISDEDFARVFCRVKEKFTVHPSFFEVMFAMAAVYFNEQKVDYIIYETGMGGRLDATNIVEPELTIITSIGYDHMEYLGDTLEKIAAEKAGIIKPGVPVIYFDRDPQVKAVIEKQAESRGAAFYPVEKTNYIINSLGHKTIDFSFHNGYYKYVHLKLGATALYQVENACLAVVAYSLLMKNIGERELQILSEGLLSFYWEGRMEEILPGVYVDGAHNVEAVTSYCDTMERMYRGDRKLLVFAVVKDKEYESMIDILTGRLSFEHIIVTNVSEHRKADIHTIAELFKSRTETGVTEAADVAGAMEMAMDIKEKSGCNVYCVGSLYLVGEVKKWLDKWSRVHRI